MPSLYWESDRDRFLKLATELSSVAPDEVDPDKEMRLATWQEIMNQAMSRTPPASDASGDSRNV